MIFYFFLQQKNAYLAVMLCGRGISFAIFSVVYVFVLKCFSSIFLHCFSEYLTTCPSVPINSTGISCLNIRCAWYFQ